MLLDLSRFRSGTDHIERRVEASAFALKDDEFRLAAPIDFVVDVQKDANKVRLVGRVKATLELECGRCLDPFTIQVDAPFDMLYLPVGTLPAAKAVDGEDETAIEEDDLGVAYYKDDQIDLGELMREQFYLALPMKPLCRPDCRGLCSICGKNRNRELCACEPKWTDPRMAELKKLLPDRQD